MEIKRYSHDTVQFGMQGYSQDAAGGNRGTISIQYSVGYRLQSGYSRIGTVRIQLYIEGTKSGYDWGYRGTA
jgi:hypothetical protein